MPHIHMLLITKKDCRITTADEIDQYVSARIPSLPAMTDQSLAAHQQRRLWHLVTTLMMHDCNDACLEEKMINGKIQRRCNKHFPKPFSDYTEVSGFQLDAKH